MELMFHFRILDRHIDDFELSLTGLRVPVTRYGIQSYEIYRRPYRSKIFLCCFLKVDKPQGHTVLLSVGN
jgi:hypothetical protein